MFVIFEIFSTGDSILAGSKPRPAPCDVCKKMFQSKSGMRRHKREFHIQCDVCPTFFLNQTVLRTHKSSHNHVCSICKETFIINSKLIIHQEVTHAIKFKMPNKLKLKKKIKIKIKLCHVCKKRPVWKIKGGDNLNICKWCYHRDFR